MTKHKASIRNSLKITLSIYISVNSFAGHLILLSESVKIVFSFIYTFFVPSEQVEICFAIMNRFHQSKLTSDANIRVGKVEKKILKEVK